MAAPEQSLSRETFFSLPAFDGKSIWCVQNNADDMPSDKIVILAHGLTGQPNEYIHMMARDYFNTAGYDVLRFAFYWFEENNRRLEDCTLDIHARDMNTVIAHARKNYKKVYVCGHSYGGLTMLFANPDADAIAFWDSSFYAWQEFMQSSAKYVPQLDQYTLGWGTTNLLGKAMIEEAKDLSIEKANTLAAAIKSPATVLKAGRTEEGHTNELYEQLPRPKYFLEIEQADHCFNKGKTVYPLLDATLNWFKKF